MGLVHDIGKITAFSELCKQFKANGEEVTPGYNAFVPLMKVISPAVSYWVAKDWDLPKEITKALAEQVNLTPGSRISQFGHILYQANLCSEAYVTLRKKNENLALRVLDNLNLPNNLYDRLDTLSKEV